MGDKGGKKDKDKSQKQANEKHKQNDKKKSDKQPAKKAQGLLLKRPNDAYCSWILVQEKFLILQSFQCIMVEKRENEKSRVPRAGAEDPSLGLC